MYSSLCGLRPRASVSPTRLASTLRKIASMAAAAPANPKREGDISDAFASLAGQKEEPLPDRYRELKISLIAGREKEIEASWKRLLAALKTENDMIVRKRLSIVPELEYSALDSHLPELRDEIQKRGVAVVRGVIPEAEARAYKNDLEQYIRKNPDTRGFPAHDRQVFELYWSAPQVKARGHPNLLRTQRALLEGLWTAGHDQLINLSTPLSYADRLRIRQPGDASFALGPHQDGGSVERWERHGYGVGKVYDEVFKGNWDGATFDMWDAGARIDARQNNYNGLGACSMFRALQGWLSMSHSGAYEGTLKVYPGVKLAVAYMLLRPFFQPVRAPANFGTYGVETGEFLHPDNWVLARSQDMNSDLQGATPGRGQEFPRAELHPHLELARTMVHVPKVKPGDYVVWHCDTIHAVDHVHNGQSDSSVLYIPVCPVTEQNAQYLAAQRQAFLDGTPAPDFPGGKGESRHVDRPTAEYAAEHLGLQGLQAMGLRRLLVPDEAPLGVGSVLESANKILGF
ncbi:uncharacterized protein PpBr36_06571 [Pyricularia pennisetigena]|uniref:uncharacterized protein n=1 Tax=Pyricularia pennisetigena TaxID=1578925 RepID=UPI00114E7B51|nr:uncharacterized protein PpBr36_06571 [Pyricularia pennisetigena]TLS22993.1 hypothetical protein PpBr36_06571 [Pyricularia pennisetigena]